MLSYYSASGTCGIEVWMAIRRHNIYAMTDHYFSLKQNHLCFTIIFYKYTLFHEKKHPEIT